ncbi:hypothetical protein [Streptomyces sp. NPDC088766]|uniref:hypothetical protein n=1 Tax=Streptomyces sp. NPDC088766 TaxID=3365893 RepID=UPI00380503B9
MTDLVLLNTRTGTVTETLATDASVIAAAGDHVIWRDDSCGKGTCTHVYDLNQRKNTAAPSCKGRDLVGTGTLDPSGRWYLSALLTHRLAILDLDGNTCHELDKLPAVSSSDLDQTFGITWAGPHVLLLDQRSGALTAVDAPPPQDRQARRTAPGRQPSPDLERLRRVRTAHRKPVAQPVADTSNRDSGQQRAEDVQYSPSMPFFSFETSGPLSFAGTVHWKATAVPSV